MADILVVDDEKGMRRSLSIALEEWGHRVVGVESGEDALEKSEKEIFDVIITDLVMDEIDGIDLLRKVKTMSPNTEVLMMSAHGTIDKAVEAMKQGACEFITKPFSMDHMKVILDRTLDQMALKKTVKHLQAVLEERYSFDNIVAESRGMREVMHQVALVANWSVPVLIQGESGVGKELVALAVHHLSKRKDQPFVPVNCGAFPDTLLDSELFGHVKGAFTGAVSTKRGLIEEANNGTLMLDEIGESPLALQVRLLRFLDNGRFRRIGESTERDSDVRIIGATNRDLNKEIEEKRFREDLFYRLSVAMIHVPPLRERKEDILALTQRFLESLSKRMDRPAPRLHPKVYEKFIEYDWPGNVRELENAMEHLLIVNNKEDIGLEDLPKKFRDIPEPTDKGFAQCDRPLEEIEKHYILSVLEKTGGNRKRAAEILKISRTTLISRLKSWEE